MQVFCFFFLTSGCDNEKYPSEKDITQAVSESFKDNFSGLIGGLIGGREMVTASSNYISFKKAKKKGHCRISQENNDIVICPVEIFIRKGAKQIVEYNIYSTTVDLDMTKKDGVWKSDPSLPGQLQLQMILYQANTSLFGIQDIE